MSFFRTLARPMLASSFVIAGVDKLKNADDTAQQLSPLLRKAAASLPFKARVADWGRASSAQGPAGKRAAIWAADFT